MIIALCSDELYPVHTQIMQWLETHNHQLIRFGALKLEQETPWVEPTFEAAKAVASGQCDEGIFFCWSGTGACIVANKVKGIRAGLCTDVQTVKDTRIWNHANVLVLSNRLIQAQNPQALIEAWFHTQDVEQKGQQGVESLIQLESLI